MHVCIHVCMHVYIYVCMQIFMCVHVYVCTCRYTRDCKCESVGMHERMSDIFSTLDKCNFGHSNLSANSFVKVTFYETL